MSLRTRLAYWLLRTDRQELTEQFRRVERDLGGGTELIQLQALIGLFWIFLIYMIGAMMSWWTFFGVPVSMRP